MKKTIGRIIRKSIAIIASVAILAAPVNAATITQWNFNSGTSGDVTNTPAASSGTGSASLLGGTTGTLATGNGGGLAWNTTTYASQSSGSGTRGVQFLFSTVGYQNLSFSYDHRASGTGSRWAQLDYTLNGTDWITGFWNNNGGLTPHDTFYSFNVDLSSITGANNNANFGVRIVSIFSPQAFDQNNSTAAFNANTAYMRANSGAVYSPSTSSSSGDYSSGGTWRFDNVTLSGDVSGGASAQNTTLNVASGTTNNSTAYSGSTDANTAGSGLLIKTGLGTLELTGSSFYTGSTQIQEGVVSVATLTGTAGPLGNGGSIAIGTGSTAGTLAYTGGDVSSARAYSLGAGGSTIDVSANNLTISTAITGSGGLTKTGAGTLTLTGNNTYTGNTVISGGVLDLNGASSGVDDNATVTIQNGATLKSTGDNETLGPIVLTSGTIVTDGANQFRSPSFTVSQLSLIHI